MVDQSNLMQRASSHSGIARRDKITELVRESTQMLLTEKEEPLIRTVSSLGPQEKLIVAIAEDDVCRLQECGYGAAELADLVFEGGMNVLNLAIEQERISIVEYLAMIYPGRPERQKLVDN